MKALWQFLLCMIWLGASIFALTKTQYPASFMLGVSVLLIPFHIVAFRLVRRSWPINFSGPVAGVIACDHLLTSAWIGLSMYIVRVCMNKPFLGFNSHDLYFGFLFGTAICLWHYLYRFLGTNWSTKFMLREAYVPPAVGQLILAAIWSVYLWT